jgi:3-hydroxyacyl-CoA dehydrogenase
MLLAEGASVGLFDVIPQEKGDAIAKELSDSGKALYVRVDITDDKAVGAAVQQVVDKYGNLKGCVHCAGIALKRDWTNDAAESIPNFKKVSTHRIPRQLRNAEIEDARRECAWDFYR